MPTPPESTNLPEHLPPPGAISRRALAKRLGVAAAGVTAATMVPAGLARAQTPAIGPVRGMAPVYDVKVYGATGNGSTDDSAAIQKAINAAGKKGGIVWFPPGVYHINSGLTVGAQVVLAGAGWDGSPATSTGALANGSWLYINSPRVFAFRITGRGAIVRDLAIAHAQPAPAAGWTPTDYPPAIQVTADDVYLQNIMLLNATRGIYLANPGGTIGRASLDRIWGQPMNTGILIDNAEDVMKVNNVHFWPFWSVDANVLAYTTSQGIAIHSYRNDNPHFSNLFAFGYATGMMFDQSTGGSTSGITSKFRISNADFDYCGYAVQIPGAGTTGQVVNLTGQGQPGVVGFMVTGANVRAQLCNVRFTNYNGNGIRVEGGNSYVFVENSWIESWNQSGRGFPGIEAVLPATVYVGLGRFFENGLGAPLTGGTGTVVLDS